MGVIEELIRNKRRGDAVRIAEAVNNGRKKRGEEPISPNYIRSMLNGNRTLTDEVKEVADRYYEVINEFEKMVVV